MATEEQTIPVDGTQGTPQAQQNVPNQVKIENLTDVVNVLLSAVDIGREKGAYDWNQLAVITKAIDFLKNNLVDKQ